MVDYPALRRVATVVLAVLLVLGIAGVAVGSQISASKTSALSAETGANKFYPGDTISYEMTVTNPAGNTETNTLTRIWDTLPNGDVIEFLDPGETLVQPPGQTDTFNATYVVDWDDAVFSDMLGYYIVTNTFEATGFDTAGDFVDVLVTRNSQVLEFAEIGDFVWNDLNRDGIQDPGEPGVEGVTVHLWSADEECEPIEVIETTTTDADGYYLFDGLRAGNYRVQFELPEGDWVFSPKDADGEGIEGEVNSDADETTGVTDCVELEPGDSKLFVDAGIYELVEDLDVSKTVETSFDRTHEWDIDKWVETEFGETLEDGTPKIWLWVDGSGDEWADWYIEVTYLGSEDHDHNVSGTVTIENTGELDAVITDVEDLLGGAEIDVDFGVEFPYTLAIGDTLEGTYDEDGYVEGNNEVTVTTERDEYVADEEIVWGDPDVENYQTVTIEDVSDEYGTMPFGMLDANDFDAGDSVTFDYDDYFAWMDYDDPDPASWSINNTATIIETEQSASAELRINWMPPASLGDFVWNDLNRDGIQDDGEPGVEGITVHLHDCETDALLATTTTDADGWYLFDNLMPGEYYVMFELPDGDWVFTIQDADGEGIEGEYNSDADPMTGATECVMLEAGDEVRYVDAGIYELVENLDVSKTVETSFDRTHEWDIDKWVETYFGHTIGEEEYPKIWLWVDGSGNECATWTVDVTYEGYEDSDFTVSGEVTIENTGDLDAVITDVEDLLGGVEIDVDFGVEFPYTLAAGDTLSGTYDEDGHFEGYNEVTVTTERDEYFADEEIVWGDPDNVYFETVDIVDVSDLFGEVDLGSVTAPEGATFTYDECFAWEDYDAPGPHIYENTATIVQTEQSASAVLYVNWMPPASLGDFVWNDLNMDGIQDDGEPGVEGVTVHLHDCETDDLLATTTTDADGYYLFDNLMPGDYYVMFVKPDGWTFSPKDADGMGIEGEYNSDADEMTGMTECVTLEAGDEVRYVDAGIYREMEICWADETAWAFGGDYAKPIWDFVNSNNWGWTNGPLGEGSYEWPIYAGAGQNILSNGEIVGTLYVEYEDGCVTVTYQLDEGYALGETHLWVGDDVLPKVQRGRSMVYTNAPGQFPYSKNLWFDEDDPDTWKTTWTWTGCGFEGDIYVAAHSVVWMQVECMDDNNDYMD